MFDSNIDPSKGHTEPLSVNLTSDESLGFGVIPGMTAALKTMQKGTKAFMFIPSGMAYGPRSQSAELPANSILIFEVEVLEVLTKAQALAASANKTAPVNKKSTTPKKLIKKVKKK